MAITTKVRGKLAVPLGGGFSAPAGGSITVSDEDGLPYDLVLDVALEDGRYVVGRLVASRKDGGAPVTTEGIRAIAVSSIIALGFGGLGLVMRWEKNPGGGARGRPLGPWSDEMTRVAGVYRAAYACGLPPTKAVAEALDIPQSTAAKKVMKARKEGLLGETSPGRAGEVTDSNKEG